MSNKSQIELIAEIFSLYVSFPNAEIKICVDNELASEFGWTNHKIKKVKLCPWIEVNDYIYTDEDLAKDQLFDELWEENITEQELEKLVNKHYSENNIQAICVFTEAV